MKIIFAGTPNFSAIHLNELIKKKYNVITIITKPDKPSGRGMKIIYSPVKKIAKKNKIPIIQSENLFKKKINNKIRSLKADILIVIAYGIIIPKKILKIFPLGGINVHPSLLPKWRGPAPIQWAILKGDKKTGITIIQMNKFFDKGKIICSFSCKIQKNDNSHTLNNKLSFIGSKALIYLLNKIKSCKKINTKKQKIIHKHTYAKKIYKIDGKINWNQKAKKILRIIQAFNPWPGAYFTINNKTIKIWKAIKIKQKYNKKIFSPGEIISITKTGINIQTKKGIIKIQEIQISGTKKITSKNILKYIQK